MTNEEKIFWNEKVMDAWARVPQVVAQMAGVLRGEKVKIPAQARDRLRKIWRRDSRRAKMRVDWDFDATPGEELSQDLESRPVAQTGIVFPGDWNRQFIDEAHEESIHRQNELRAQLREEPMADKDELLKCIKSVSGSGSTIWQVETPGETTSDRQILSLDMVRTIRSLDSDRNREVLLRVIRGDPQNEIAIDLGITDRTVRDILKKLRPHFEWLKQK